MIEILNASEMSIDDIVSGRDEGQPDVSGAVREILQQIKQRGDDALREYTHRFDGVMLQDFRVTPQEIEDAKNAVGEKLLSVIADAAENIRAYHEMQVQRGFTMTNKPGIIMGQKITALKSVGLYVPGGTAAYPSTVLMDAIPAKIAGVEKLVMVTPPSSDGSVTPAILAAASVAGVDEIYKIGGAQAVGALCYGTGSIPRVDKIVGPGNMYVATAKMLVYGSVDIDMIAGPSDVLIVADDSANPCYVAADMLAQAEHDIHAASVLVTTSETLAKAVQAELETQLKALSRSDIARQSLLNNGKIIIVPSIEKGMEVANALAPEHLELSVQEPFALMGLVQNAGSVFLGHYTPEALGDYYAGPNHTLPTGGTARFYSPLSVDDFIKKTSFLHYSKEALHKVGDAVELFAQSEGLTAHAASVTVRMPKG